MPQQVTMIDDECMLEDQNSLMLPSDKNHLKFDPISSDEQSLNVNSETGTYLGDDSYEYFIFNDSLDVGENLEDKLGVNITLENERKLEPDQVTQNKNKTTTKVSPPQVCIDTLTDLIEKYQPMSTKHPREQGDRWDALTVEYWRLRPNFNGYGDKNKDALKAFYQESSLITGLRNEVNHV